MNDNNLSSLCPYNEYKYKNKNQTDKQTQFVGFFKQPQRIVVSLQIN